MKKGILAVLLAVMMIIAYIPTTVLAAEGTDEAVANQDVVEETDVTAEDAEEFIDDTNAPKAGVNKSEYDEMFSRILFYNFENQAFFDLADGDEFVTFIDEYDCNYADITDVYNNLKIIVTYNNKSYMSHNSDLDLENNMFELKITGFPFSEVQPGETYQVIVYMDINNYKKEQITRNILFINGKYANTWTGKTIKPKVTVKYNNTTLTNGTDYKLSYKYAGKNVGEHYIMLNGLGKYFDTCSIETDFEVINEYGIDCAYMIIPKGTSISKLRAKTGAIKVSWKKQKRKMSKKRITGYQVQVATDSEFTTGKQSVRVSGYKKTSKTISNLEEQQEYYVRVRTYRKMYGTYIYSNWSKVKTVTTK